MSYRYQPVQHDLLNSFLLVPVESHLLRGVDYFFFMDDNLALSKGHILSLCQEIKNSGLDIQFDTPNGVCLNTLDEDVVAALSDAGLVKTSLAIEHGSDYIRNEAVSTSG